MASTSSFKSIPSVKLSNTRSSSSSITQNLKSCNLSHPLSSSNLKISTTHQGFSTRAPSNRLTTNDFFFDYTRTRKSPLQISAIMEFWRPINNTKATEVIEAAQFAVTKLSEQTNSRLTFMTVVEGLEMGSGSKYKLTIAANNGAVAGKYMVEVHVGPRKHSKSLKWFRKV